MTSKKLNWSIIQSLLELNIKSAQYLKRLFFHLTSSSTTFFFLVWLQQCILFECNLCHSYGNRLFTLVADCWLRMNSFGMEWKVAADNLHLNGSHFTTCMLRYYCAVWLLFMSGDWGYHMWSGFLDSHFKLSQIIQNVFEFTGNFVLYL